MTRFYLGFALALALLATVGNQTSASDPLDAKTMKVALHTATPEENGFIEYVLARVDAGTLPLDMVQSTFLWAKKKSRYQFQYFKRGLRYRAAQHNIPL